MVGVGAKGIDGVVCAQHGVGVVLHGGRAASCLWELNLPAVAWSEHECTGDVPPPRLHHAGAVFMGHLLICGGEVLSPLSSADSGPLLADTAARRLSYYELDLSTLVWHAVPTTGPIPFDRSHHSVSLVRCTLVVVGGKPTSGPAARNAGAFYEMSKATGFYDAHFLDVPSRTWRTLTFLGTPPPMLWGHAAVGFNSNYVICFGGMDVSVPSGASFDSDGPPVAALSNTVHVLDVAKATWSRCTPPVNGVAPLPRTLHRAQCFGKEMLVVGGVTVSAHGLPMPLVDGWRWNIETGDWTPQPLPVVAIPCLSPPLVMYYDQLVMLPSLHDVHFLDTRGGAAPWQSLAATIASQHWVRRSPYDEANSTPAPGASTTQSGAVATTAALPASSDRFVLERLAQQAVASREAQEQLASQRMDGAFYAHQAPPTWWNAAPSGVSAEDVRAVQRKTAEVPLPANPWAVGAIEGDRVLRGPRDADAVSEVAALRAEVERLRRLTEAHSSDPRDRHAASPPGRHAPVVVHYEPGRTVVAGPSLRDELEPPAFAPTHPSASAVGGSGSVAVHPAYRSGSTFMDYFIAEQRQRVDMLDRESADQAARLAGMLLRRSNVPEAALPDALKEYRRFREEKRSPGSSRSATPTATQYSASPATAAAAASKPSAVAAASATSRPSSILAPTSAKPRRTLESPNRDFHTDALAMLPSGRSRHPGVSAARPLVADPSWKPPAPRY